MLKQPLLLIIAGTNPICVPDKTWLAKTLFTLLLLSLLLPASISWAQVTASTGRTVLSIDETIALQIKSENSSGDPDLSVLNKDFQILGTSRSQNYSFINGTSSRTHIWNITLLAKKTGEVTIPALQVGDETTKAIHLVIQKKSITPGIDGKEAFLKISLSNDSTASGDKNSAAQYYVQQQILIKVQLFHRIRFTNATLSELELNNTVIEKLGEDSRYNKTVSNHRYNVIERNYAIYPQQSGELIIPAITFNGNAEIRQNFSLFSRPGRQIVSRTKPVKLTIMPIPENYTGKHWLPAENLSIEAEILEDTNSIISGEAITRHIIIRATGLLGSQLPAINLPSSKAIKTYPDKEKLKTQLVNGKVVGTRRDTIAIIPLKAGEFILPEIKIDWWNVNTRQQETAVLNAKTFVAQKNTSLENIDNPIQTATSAENNTNSTQNAETDNKQAVKTIEKIVYKPVQLSRNIWFWISSGLLIIWLMTLILLIIVKSNKLSSSKNSALQHNTKSAKEEHQLLLKTLYGYCGDNDAHNASDALVYWAQCYFNKPLLTGLSQIIDMIDDQPLINAINTLESSQYSANKQSWTGDELSSSITEFIQQDKLQKESQQQSQQGFTPLNPLA